MGKKNPDRHSASLIVLVSSGLLLSCGGEGGGGQAAPATDGDIADLRATTLENPVADITSQCFTKTQDVAGCVHNLMLTC